jgi:hypothetical protein
MGARLSVAGEEGGPPVRASEETAVVLDSDSARLNKVDEVVSELGDLAERTDPGEGVRLIAKFGLRTASSAGRRNLGCRSRSTQTEADHEVAVNGSRATNKALLWA